MDAAFEVAVAREDGDDVQVVVLDLLLDLACRERTRVAYTIMHNFTVRDERVQIINRDIEDLMRARVAPVDELQRERGERESLLVDAIPLLVVGFGPRLEAGEPVASADLLEHSCRR